MFKKILSFFKHKKDHPSLTFFKFIGPGLLVTVGFIDPGNWASNLAAGGQFGYSLLWVMLISTIMLIVLQHNVAQLGIVTGKCLSESITAYFPKVQSKFILSTAMLASIATSLAEILGAAIALQILFHIPLKLGAIMSTVFLLVMIFSNSYPRIERWIIGFVSLVGFSFLVEIFLAPIDWKATAVCSVTPSFPAGSIMVIMSLIGAVVMPHNLFLHSEVIQSRQWNLENEVVLEKHFKYEFIDTLFSMGIGWAINSAMIVLAAGTFFVHHIPVTDLGQAKDVLTPLLGKSAGLLFGLALLFSGIASTITSGMAGGVIFSGMFGEPFDIEDFHSRAGAILSLIPALIIILFIKNSFQALIISQIVLSIQLPITIYSQIRLTSAEAVMGKHKNSGFSKVFLVMIGLIVSALNLYLLFTLFKGS